MITITKYSRQSCRPCAVLSNFFSQINLAEHDAELIEVDVADLTDEQIEALRISSVPTTIIARNGLEVTRFVGLRGTDEIVDAIEHAKEVR
jgi:thioredoxin 1